jgi:dTDP-4-amino-4,6-dideoxygalactose transaminase|tara:strand:+ start:9624 stop:10271 length:648 start_codon:yes stop_codon:yes gene_type:complete
MNLVEKYMKEFDLKDPWDVVDLFEKKVAKYSGSKYAVSVDNCTDALFLCLKYLNASGEITIPKRTYVSVPCTVIHAGCQVKFEDVEWSGVYQLKPYPVYDSATRMSKGMYVKDSYYCLSFHRRKHLPIGKGGMILTNDEKAYDWFKVARYEGRHIDRLYKDDTFDMIGWNMYMPPEQAAEGLELLEDISDFNEDLETSGVHKDLSKFPIYEKANR